MKKSIFINGILRRSGTNFLNQLLLLHPEVKQPSIKIRENWFLEYTSQLEYYTNSLDSHWKNKKWKGYSYNLNNFKKEFGDCLLNFLKNHEDFSSQQLLTKTPSFSNLDKFDAYFPDSKLILVIRNPFDVAASTYKTWHTPIKRILLQWQQSVLEAYRLEQKAQAFIVRYEDLITDSELQVENCLSYLNLDNTTYPWEEVNKLPVFGSSDQGSSWKVTQKNSDFKSVNKWEGLTKELMNELEKNNNEAINAYFGYDNYLITKELKPLPDYENRLKIGGNSFDINSGASGKEELKRIQELKKGLKIIYKALKP